MAHQGADLKHPLAVHRLSRQVRLGLVLWTALLTIPIPGLVTYIAYRSLLGSVVELQRYAATAGAERITAYVEDLHRRLTFLSRLRGLSEMQPEVRGDVLRALTRHNSAYEEVAFANDSGQVVLSVSPYGPARFKGQVSPRSWRAYLQRKDYIGPVEIDPRIGAPSMIFAVPLRDRHERVSGMLLARVNLRYLWNVVSEIRVGQTGYAYVVDGRDRLISAPEISHPVRTIHDLTGQVAVLARSDDSSESYVGLRGHEVIGAARPVHLARWRVIAELPIEEALGAVERMMRIISLAAAFGVLVAIGGGLLFEWRVLAPLRKLTGAAAKVREGQLGARADVRGRNELGQLASTFNEMTARLQETIEQVNQQIAQTRAAVRARDVFLSVASHELRTPLTPLKLQLQLVEQMLAGGQGGGDEGPVETAKLQNALAICLRQVSRLTILVNRLLDVSRIAAGRLDIEREDVDLTDLVQDVARRFGRELDELGVDLRVSTPGVVRGLFDPVRIDQVVTNLLSNAIKYGEGRPIDLELRDRGARVQIVVVDRGIGIPDEAKTRVFDRFERAVSERHYGGLGLGLYIARQIVLAHGGTISLSSTPGQGTRFVVELPRAANVEEHAT